MHVGHVRVYFCTDAGQSEEQGIHGREEFLGPLGWICSGSVVEDWQENSGTSGSLDGSCWSISDALGVPCFRKRRPDVICGGSVKIGAGGKADSSVMVTVHHRVCT